MQTAAININYDSLGYAYGFPDGYEDPSFSRVADRFLRISDRFHFKYSMYVIGRDLQNPFNRKRVRDWASDGHEIGNHSHSHKLFCFRSPGFMEEDLRRAQETIDEGRNKVRRI